MSELHLEDLCIQVGRCSKKVDEGGSRTVVEDVRRKAKIEENNGREKKSLDHGQ